jgi:hypothetical protein
VHILEKNISPPPGRGGEWKPANISWWNSYEKLKRKTGKTKEKGEKQKRGKQKLNKEGSLGGSL